MTQREIDQYAAFHAQDAHQRAQGLMQANQAAGVTAMSAEQERSWREKRFDYAPTPDENSEFASLCRCQGGYCEEADETFAGREEFDSLSRSDRWFPVAAVALILLLIVLAVGLYQYMAWADRENADIFNRATAQERRAGFEVGR